MSPETYVTTAQGRYRRVRAKELGCDETAFHTHELTIVERPADTPGHPVMLALTFGTGTVVSVEPQYLDWVREYAPAQHYRALIPNMLPQPLVDEGVRRGDPLYVRRLPNLTLLPSAIPVARPVPDALRIEAIDAARRLELLPSATFDNALGEPGEAYTDESWRFGLALMDGDAVAALAGAYDDGDGVMEIGVDVARAYRGRSLASIVVSGIAAAIHDRGCIPSYCCSPTNVLSHRTALACGFVPVASSIRVSRSTP